MPSVILLIIAFLVSLIIYSVKKPTNFPPGPLWLPVVGCTFYLRKAAKSIGGGQHLLLQKLSEEWKTNVLGLKLGEQLIVSVSTYSVIKKLFDSNAFDARPINFFGKLRTIGADPGITCAEGVFWLSQKKIIVRYLRNVGLGKSIMEAKIKEELDDITQLIDTNNVDVPIGKLIQPAVVNLIWSLIAGSRISRNNPRLQRLLHLLDQRGEAFDMGGGTLSNYPWLRFVAPERVGYNLIKRLNANMKAFLMEAIDEHHKTWTDGNNSDLMYSFISRMNLENGKSSTFTNDQLLMVCVDLFVAGAHSTGGTLEFACLMMLLHPDVQAKAQSALDKAFVDGHSFTYSDRHEVPYIQAILCEVERLCHVLPIAGSRRAIRDTTLEGYAIPKDTTILINLYSVFMSKEIWNNPEVFRPERFINDNGKLHVFEEFVPFSTGRRRCLGEPLAQSFLFIVFAELLKKYTILPLEGKPLPSALPRPGIVCLPQPYSARFMLRKHNNND